MKSPSLSRRQALIGGLFLTVSGVAAARAPVSTIPKVPEARFNGWIPSQVGPWAVEPSSAVVLPPPDQLSDRLYDDLATRAYVAEDLPAMMLLIAYNNIQNGVVQVHLPEKCYSASGFRVAGTSPLGIKTPGGSVVPANQFTGVSTERTEHVVYWTRVGNEFPRSWSARHLAVMKANLAREVPDGVIVRASVVGDDAAGNLPQLERFIALFLAASPPSLRKLLLGPLN